MVAAAPVTPPIGIYVRVSRKGDREDDRFHSPREQAERAEGLARAKGFTPGPVFEDIDVSGATPPADRPSMGRLLEVIDRGELGGIAAYSLDRLSRDPAHGDDLVRRVTRAGGVLLTPDMPEAIESPTGQFTFGMLLQVAKLYRSQAGARFASAKERAILAGIPVGPPPVGYRRIGETDRRLEPDPEAAPLVRELFERRVRGETYTPLADLMRDATGHPWTLSGVARVLRNRIYATGRLEYGTVVSEYATEAIVDEALWHAVQAVAPRRPPRSADAGWLLTGLVRCAACDRALSCHLSGRGSKYRRYRCRNRACTAKANVTAPDLELLAYRRSRERTTGVDMGSEAPDLSALEAAVTVGERRLTQVLAPEAQDALGDAWAATVKARRTERDAALAALGGARVVADVPAGFVDLVEVWHDLTPLERREAMWHYWKVIRVAKGGAVTLVARGPHAGGMEIG